MRALALAVSLAGLLVSQSAQAGPCDGRYLGMLTVQGERGVSLTPMQWTVRETTLYGGFEGPSGLYMVEATVDGGCNVVTGKAADYVEGEPMPMQGSVLEGLFKHNGPVRVTYRMKKEDAVN